jgi:23S rRNA pseudouridine955/2504/2580 synthase
MAKEFHITEDQAGRRIDRLLRAMWPQVPLGAIMRALRKGEVRLDAKKITPDTKVGTGQFLQVPWNDDFKGIEPDYNVLPQNRVLETIYKDDYLWIINKPAGLLTQPDVKNGDSLITRALVELKWNRQDFHPSTLQRLDRNTSGIIIVALRGQAQRLLSEMIRLRTIKKVYRLVVNGEIAQNGRIDFPLSKDHENNIVCVDENGQKALTIYKKIYSGDGYSCAEAELVTGRSHQIRVHFAAIGHPIWGDIKYGGKGKAKRPLLHAYSVSFPTSDGLPDAVRGKTFFAPLPDDMKKYFTIA